MGFPGSTVVKNLPANAGDTGVAGLIPGLGDAGLIPGLGRFPEERNVNPSQYSCLGSSMDGGAWQATVHGVAESDMTELKDEMMNLFICHSLFLSF